VGLDTIDFFTGIERNQPHPLNWDEERSRLLGMSNILFSSVPLYGLTIFFLDMFDDNNRPSGVIRCATSQHQQVLQTLLSTGRFAPERDELRKHEIRGCASCESEEEWCFTNAHDWMYQEMQKRLQCENTGGVWLWTRGDPNESIESARYSADHDIPTGAESDVSMAEDSRRMVVMVFDIPLERMLRSDEYLWHEVVNNRPIIHREGLIVDNDDREAFQPHLERFTDYHENSALTEGERDRRKVESWQILFDETRWADDVFDGVYGTYDSQIHAVTPYLILEDLVSIHTRDCDGDWMEEQIEFIRTSEGVRVINLKCENNRVRRRNPAILRHMRILGKYRGKAKRKRGGLRKLRSPVPVSDNQGPVSAKDIIGGPGRERRS